MWLIDTLGNRGQQARYTTSCGLCPVLWLIDTLWYTGLEARYTTSCGLCPVLWAYVHPREQGILKLVIPTGYVPSCGLKLPTPSGNEVLQLVILRPVKPLTPYHTGLLIPLRTEELKLVIGYHALSSLR